ncbi:MAG: glycosyltransferase family 39 protein [Deltaproteobacteria bacterium]|nr:glycosyltransferase family 39 protein [Deltaproteobacteria bacterium]
MGAHAKHLALARGAWLLGAAALLLGAFTHRHDDPWDYDEGPLLQASALWREGDELYVTVPFNKPPVLALWLRLVFALGGQSVPAVRLSLAALSALGVLCLGALTEGAFGALASVVCVALWCLLPEVPARAGAVMPDFAALALGLGALVALERAQQRPGWRPSVLAGALLALSLGCQTAMVTLLPVFVLSALWRPPGALHAPSRVLGTSALAAAVTALGILLPFDTAALLRWVLGYNLAGREVAGALAGRSGALVLATLVQHRWLALLGALGAVLAWRERALRREVARVGLWWATTALALCLWRPLWGSYLVLLLLPLAVLAGAAVGQVVRYRTNGGRWALVVVSVLSIALLWQRAGDHVPWTGRSYEALRLRRDLRARVRPGERVLTDAQFEVFAAGRRVPARLADTSFKRVRTGLLTMRDLERELRRPEVRWALLATGRLEELPGLVPWLEARSVGRWRYGGATLYALPPP